MYSEIIQQVSIDSSSPRLSDTKLYPSFVRPVPPDDSISSAVVALMKYFDWKHLAIITQEEDLFTLVSVILLSSLKNYILKEYLIIMYETINACV